MVKYQAQMALDLHKEKKFLEKNFISGVSNATARAWLMRDIWPEGRLWLWGASGTGKTHLIRIWAKQHEVDVMEAKTLSRDEHGDILANGRVILFHRPYLVVDHLDKLSDEIALFHLLNRAHSENIRVLMAARYPPARHHFVLPDLASRLRATMTALIEEPEDKLRATLLLSLLAKKQLVVSQSVTDWLCRHLPRTGEAFVQAVERLDEAALERGSSITRSLAQEVLKDLLY